MNKEKRILVLELQKYRLRECATFEAFRELQIAFLEMLIADFKSEQESGIALEKWVAIDD